LTEQRGQQPDAAIAILNTSGMNDRVQQQTLHVDENMSFLAFDQFARIEPVRINAGPPFVVPRPVLVRPQWKPLPRIKMGFIESK
jgi:hypothetical protein